MHNFNIKQGDTRPSIEVQLLDEQNDPRDLTNVTAVRFHMESVDTGQTTVDNAATIINADDGIVTYAWADGDTDTPGRYDAEFEVEYSDGNIETFPNNGYISVYVEEELA